MRICRARAFELFDTEFERGPTTEAQPLSDWFFRRGKRENIDGLSLDSWIDSSLAESWSRIKDYWNAGSSFFARFRLTGWRRLLNEAASEGLTLGLGGIFVLFALALPAFVEFDEGRFLTGRYSNT